MGASPEPAWQPFSLGGTGARAVMTTRGGGASPAPWASLNLGDHVGDEAARVAHNRALFAARIGATPVYLRQVHGSRVIRLGAADAAPGAPVHEADASVCTEPGIACTVLVADCLPVLMAAPGVRGVAAAHAGWRGLAQGVVEAALEALCEATGCAPQEIDTWLGACIGPAHFEVGAEVLEACGDDPAAPLPSHFVPSAAVNGVPKWRGDLARLARDRLLRRGVRSVAGNGSPGYAGACTVSDASRFFSFRRDGVTGRMAAAVWLG